MFADVMKADRALDMAMFLQLTVKRGVTPTKEQMCRIVD